MLRFPQIADSARAPYYVWVGPGPGNRDDGLALWSIQSYSRVTGREVLLAYLSDPPGDAAPDLVRGIVVTLLLGLAASFGWLVAALTSLALPPASGRLIPLAAHRWQRTCGSPTGEHAPAEV